VPNDREVLFSLVNSMNDDENISITAEGMHQNGDMWLRHYIFTINEMKDSEY
jgi:hypothetical protein